MGETYSIGKFSELTGIPIRTLHYYDEIGLLRPEKQPNGRRLYRNKDVEQLQKIVSLKFCGFSLEQIRSLLQYSSYDVSILEMLELHKLALDAKKQELEASMQAIERIIAVVHDEGELEHHTLFSFIRNMQQEGNQRDWIARHLSEKAASNLFNISMKEVNQLDQQFVGLTREVKQLAGLPPDAPEVEAMVGSYVKQLLHYVDQDMIDRLQEIDPDKFTQLERMVEVPFTDKEVEWLEQAMAHYMNKFGMRQGDEKSENNR
ncbi:hypothetical protein J40TS1_30020 [Paenibacillus montaniterrae]|uniref:HTH merR-type domain-containing protein n=1 Tax=Paenibacillus montaniterrae TaxID=429341 RepID=A0A920CYG1_9BACL|nr:MerR family transcriptional regulator [Paenibacillus montaniterrae]GIP17360.1 hypothetical protein J40TS1_30020 [Paenibacillus montaniterrae]